MRLPYETSTAGDRALSELQRTLGKFGCQSFGTMTDHERGLTIIQFKHLGRIVSLEVSWKGYATAYLKAHPWRYGGRRRITRQQYEEAALKQARISVCSVLRDWVKGQITAIECGVMSFEEAFLPHLLMDNSRRVADHLRDNNLLPGPEKK